MSREKLKELLKRRSTKAGSVIIAAAIVLGGSVWAWKDSQVAVPELVTFVDIAGDVTVEEEDTPLAKPKLSKKNATLNVGESITLKLSNSKGKVKWSTSSKSIATVTNSGKITGKKAGTAKITAKAGSKKYTCKITVKAAAQAATTVSVRETKTKDGGSTVAAAAAAPSATTAAAVSKVRSAFDKMGFTMQPVAGVNYDGKFDARTRTITLNSAKDTSQTQYHELGHFLAFIAGNYDTSAEFAAIFGREKAKYTYYNKAYVLQNASEYFAESFKNYTFDPAELQASRPETYAAIEACLAKVTDAQITAIMNAYSAIWK